MSIERKLIGTTDAATSSAVYVEDVFSTWLYTGNGGTQTIANGIDVATKGGMVWTKKRNISTGNHVLSDTVRGTSSIIFSNSTIASTNLEYISSFNSNGYSLGSVIEANHGGYNFVGWTFAKQAKFFDVVTWTGNGVSGRQIAHSLGAVPGMIIVKSTSHATSWMVYHKSSGRNKFAYFNGPAATETFSNFWGTSDPTASSFGVSDFSEINASGRTYVAYLFADSNSGGFGPAGTDSVVACGSYTGNGSASGPTVTLGWEPQFVIVKNASATGDWNIFDNMRGIATGGNDPYLFANSSAAEATNGDLIDLTPTGFVIKSINSQVNTSSNNYIYLAIRRGPMRTPTDATKVFAPVAYAGNSTGSTKQTLSTGFPPDLAILRAYRSFTQNVTVYDRLRGNARVSTNINNAESGGSGSFISWSDNMQFVVGPDSETNPGYTDGNVISWMFRRAPGFFDVVCYTGDGLAYQNISHNLGVRPQLVIVKRRNATGNWATGYAPSGSVNDILYLNSSAFSGGANGYVDTFFQTFFRAYSGGTSSDDVNASGSTYVAYLFATCPGVSKCGSYTGNGSSQTIDCGFASGARFVLIKRTDSTGDWYVWDVARGIVSGNDPRLSLNTTEAEDTTDDSIDPASSGFIVNQLSATNINVSGASYLYLAVA